MGKALNRHYWLSILLAFIIPLFPVILPALLVLLIANWISVRNKNWNILQRQHAPFLLIAFFFVYHLLGVVWSDNQSFAWFDIQIKLSFLLLPIIFITTPTFEKKEFNIILNAFVFGCAGTVLFGVSNGLYEYYIGESSYLNLYHTKISPLLHIGYFSMYLNTAIAVLAFQIMTGLSQGLRKVLLVKIALAILFATATFLSTSLNGIIGLGVVLLSSIVIAVIKSKKWFLLISFMLLSWIFIFSFFRVSIKDSEDKYGVQNVEKALGGEELKKNEHKSSSVRVLIWRSAAELIQQAPLLGQGTGDVKDRLVETYKKHEYKYPYEKRYNAHSQFLQTAVALGVPATLLLILMFFSPLIASWKRIHFLGVFLSIIITVACLTESILEVQAGVVFYTFFASLFAQNMRLDYGTNFIDNPLIIKRKKHND